MIVDPVLGFIQLNQKLFGVQVVGLLAHSSQRALNERIPVDFQSKELIGDEALVELSGSL
jgi:hypothetical protein